ATGPAGQALAARAFLCGATSSAAIPSGGPLTFRDLQQMGFGSSISTTGTFFTSIVLQSGIYQLNLSGGLSTSSGAVSVSVTLNQTDLSTVGPPGTLIPWGATRDTNVFVAGGIAWDLLGGDRVIAVTQDSSVLQFVVAGNDVHQDFCELVITQLSGPP